MFRTIEIYDLSTLFYYPYKCYLNKIFYKKLFSFISIHISPLQTIFIINSSRIFLTSLIIIMEKLRNLHFFSIMNKYIFYIFEISMSPKKTYFLSLNSG